MTFTINDQSAVQLSVRPVAPAWLTSWWSTYPGACRTTHDVRDVMDMALKTRPRLIVLDGCGDPAWTTAVLEGCRRLKRDAYTGIVPVFVIVPAEAFAAAFEAGADEVVRDDVASDEALARLGAMLRRSDRDTDVHPSTRLPGAREIEAELERRVRCGEKFAACYADLDHFKEFNDRYGYHHGDQVIRLLARILHDVVKGLCGEDGFVGHIGGDDFLYTIPLAAVPRVCDEVVHVFDELIPLQYSEQDRRVGYFFGKDRRGQLHRVPLMTLSVGVVTNQRRHFTRGIEVSELATEMKSYAKTLPGSVWAVDRRRDEPGTVSATGGGLVGERVDQRSAGGAS
ncbi:GGDEF domain-containing protein [Gemmatimonas sp.]|jgi:diguanylate cyclase (GGDEF)-like protein|uniref:GGDEF domain-containing protein n=1 Tax=Gemmatimonas sp. TaxID=1962908 RepID=UPI0022C44932|nr:GGDEF domain-containing protein [Gemmatimonas sp.]MCZ8206548.1 GGDEF domain-containing protein [Gemmatimonas sp.]